MPFIAPFLYGRDVGFLRFTAARAIGKLHRRGRDIDRIESPGQRFHHGAEEMQIAGCEAFLHCHLCFLQPLFCEIAHRGYRSQLDPRFRELFDVS